MAPRTLPLQTRATRTQCQLPAETPPRPAPRARRMPRVASRARPLEPGRSPSASAAARATPRAAMERIEGAAVHRCVASPYLRPLTLHYRQVSPLRPRLPRPGAPPTARGPAHTQRPAPPRSRVRWWVRVPRPRACPGQGGTPQEHVGDQGGPSLHGGFAGHRSFLQWDLLGSSGIRESFLEVVGPILGRGGREGRGRRGTWGIPGEPLQVGFLPSAPPRCLHLWDPASRTTWPSSPLGVE